jgi:fumarate reductase subunit C
MTITLIVNLTFNITLLTFIVTLIFFVLNAVIYFSISDKHLEISISNQKLCSKN